MVTSQPYPRPCSACQASVQYATKVLCSGPTDSEAIECLPEYYVNNGLCSSMSHPQGTE
jgi:hypothetical protein